MSGVLTVSAIVISSIGALHMMTSMALVIVAAFVPAHDDLYVGS